MVFELMGFELMFFGLMFELMGFELMGFGIMFELMGFGIMARNHFRLGVTDKFCSRGFAIQAYAQNNLQLLTCFYVI